MRHSALARAASAGGDPAPRGAVLRDDELALHAGGPVAVDRAVEGVGPLLEVAHADGRRLALADRLALDVDAMALDRDRVHRARRVGHRDRDLAVLGLERLDVEG